MISEKAIVESNKIGKNCTIKENSIIRSEVVIGNNVIIHPNVVIEDGTVISDNVEIFPGSYIGKIPKGAGSTARPISFKKEIYIGENCSIGPNSVIFYDVIIGNNTLIGDGASIREMCRVGSYCIISRYVTLNYNALIGDHTKIMDLTHITGNCKIGNNVFISIHVSTVNDNVVVGRDYDEQRIIGPQIEDDVTIGAGAILLPNVSIGKGTMIGAGSVVTKSIPEKVLAMGIPARIIKSL
jgi:acetyltransferase-like isoleucine patch superfamily enzyme